MWCAAYQKQKLLLAHGHDHRVSCCDHGCAARAMVDQGHLAENAEFRQGIEVTIPKSHFHLATLNYVQFLRRMTFAKDRVACLIAARWCPRTGQNREINGGSLRHIIPLDQKIRSACIILS